MQQQIQKQIEEKKLKIVDLQNTINELFSDPKIIPEIETPFGQGKYALEGGQWDSRCEQKTRKGGGCGALAGNYFNKRKEIRDLAIRRHVTPLRNRMAQLNKEVKDLELKSTLPYLRNELLSNVSEFDTLEETDPQYRQKQIDLKKSIYKQSYEVDKLENQFNWFGNIPSMKPEIITPDPVVQTKTELSTINKTPLIIGGIVGLAALFLIWRFK